MNRFVYAGFLLIALVAPSRLAASEPSGAPAKKIDFARDIRPILANHCWACHGPDEKTREAGLRLDMRESATAKLKNGHIAVVPGNTPASALVGRIESTKESHRMPPADSKKPLSESQKQLLKRWIEQGAEYQQHWAFVTPKRPALPGMKNKSWLRNPIDAFILQRLEQEGLTPSPEASKQALLRRVSLDLTGLPPSLEDLDAYLRDPSPSAYEKAVDRLLASTRYAERMTMPWLDGARYADTNGYNNDEERSMWPWRDWVINAFHTNMPYDRFIIEQIAGDLLPKPTLQQKIATGFNRNHVLTTEGGIFEEEYRVEYVADRVHTTASMFLGLSMQCARCHDHKYDPIAQKEYYQFFAFFNNISDKVVNYNKGGAAEPYVRYVSAENQAKLGQLKKRRSELEQSLQQRTTAIDPELAAWEVGLSPADIQALAKPAGASQTTSKKNKETKASKGDTTARKDTMQASGIAAVLKIAPEQRTAMQWDLLKRFYVETIDADGRKFKAEWADVERQHAALEKAFVPVMVMAELTPPRQGYVLKRGQYDQPGEKVNPGVPAMLPAMPKAAPANRLGLAQWLVDPANPLTARVAVNRWWAMYFATGLVETVEDFGLQGDLPSHPELLDWLATELIRTGWNVKAMQKLIVTSATYRQSSRVTKALLDLDPKNRLLARAPRVRLPAETIRDNALAISGLLKDKVGGPSVRPYQPDGLWEDVSVNRQYKYVHDKGDGLYRRSMYTFWRRTCPPASMALFDAPDRETCFTRRARTNTPLHALVLLNDPTYLEAARELAERVMHKASTPEARLELAYRLALARMPDAKEQTILLGMLRESLEKFRIHSAAATKLLNVGDSPRDPRLSEAELAAWTTVMNLLLNLDETISKL